MAARLPVLRSGEVDGVPAYWIKRPGPLRVALSFRVGQADEPLPLRGISHLVEHLSLHDLHGRGYAHNGMVDEDRTIGYAAGKPEEMVDFLGTFTRGLSDLPTERLATEQRILRTEAAQRGFGPFDLLLLNRYGARGYGRPAYDEFGLRWLTEERVRDWAATRFTRGNAALFLSGPPPAGLRLHLPDGERMPPPETRAFVEVPGWLSEDLGGVAFSVMSQRSAIAVAATSLLARRLHRRLRHDEGVVYAVESYYGRRGPLLAESMFWLRALDECHEQVVAGTTELLAELAEPAVTDEEMEHLREQTEQRLADLDGMVGIAETACYDELAGARVRSVREIVAEQRELDPDAVAAALGAMARSALVAVPLGCGMPPPYVPVPVGSDGAVTGTEYRPPDRKAAERLVVAREGVTVSTGDGRAVTVRFDRCEAVLWWNDGSRRLIGDDGFAVSLAPERWARYPDALARIDTGVPRERWVPMGDRTGAPPPEPGRTLNPVEIWRRAPGMRIAAFIGSAVAAGILWDEWSTWLDGERPMDAWTSSAHGARVAATICSVVAVVVALLEVLIRVAARRSRRAAERAAAGAAGAGASGGPAAGGAAPALEQAPDGVPDAAPANATRSS